MGRSLCLKTGKLFFLIIHFIKEIFNFIEENNLLFYCLTSLCSSQSGTLRWWLQRKYEDEWLNITGALECSSAADAVSQEVWERSMIIPSRFISSTTACEIQQNSSFTAGTGGASWQPEMVMEKLMRLLQSRLNRRGITEMLPSCWNSLGVHIYIRWMLQD